MASFWGPSDSFWHARWSIILQRELRVGKLVVQHVAHGKMSGIIRHYLCYAVRVKICRRQGPQGHGKKCHKKRVKKYPQNELQKEGPKVTSKRVLRSCPEDTLEPVSNMSAKST